MLNFNTKINKVISGGQTGADRAGLEAARTLGIETGGTAPKSFRTQNGNDTSLIKFGLIEDDSFAYPPRTKKNVKNSDGTIIIAMNLNSPGCSLTQKYISQYSKPVFLVQLTDDGKIKFNSDLNDAVKWVFDNGILVLNVAGNREVIKEGQSLVFNPAFKFMHHLIRKVNDESI